MTAPVVSGQHVPDVRGSILVAWDDTNSKFIPVQVDADGKLLVGGVSIGDVSIGAVTLGNGGPTEAKVGSGVAANALRTVLATDVGLPAGEGHIGAVGGALAQPEATFSRPGDTTAYQSGDLVANSTTAGSVAPMSWSVARVAAGSFSIVGATLRKSGTNITNANFRLHLFRAQPGVANGDNGAFSPDHSADWLGSIDFAIDKAFSDGAVAFTVAAIPIKLASGQTVYGLLEARGGYAPSNAEAFQVRLVADLD